MFRILRIIFLDFAGLWRVCGAIVAMRWLLMIARTAPSCVNRGNLQPADRAMGHGPFHAKLGPAKAILQGDQIISSIREVWVRDVYLNHGRLQIPDGSIVVDLGASLGDFTLLALAHGPRVRVIAVEEDAGECEKLRANLALNGWQHRVTICNRRITGYASPATGHENIHEDEFVELYHSQPLDLLKCDIEGAEYQLLTPNSRLLLSARQLAIEVHSSVDDPAHFVDMLSTQGFDVVVHRTDVTGIILSAVRKPLVTTCDDT